MLSLNKVTLAGNLTRDPEQRYTPSGTAIAEFGLAVNRKWRDSDGEQREDVTFVDITFWGRTAEVICKHLAKGSPIYLEGRLQLDSWDDAETGQKRYKLKVIGQNFQFLPDGKQNQQQSQPSEPASTSGRKDGKEYGAEYILEKQQAIADLPADESIPF